MIFYFDTSALIKKYIPEKDSEVILDIWEKAEGIGISKVGYAEVMAVFYRKKREGHFPSPLFRRILQNFKEDWKSFILIEVSPALETIIERLCSRHSLRGFDALHLASAGILRDKIHQPVGFVCIDIRLREAADQEHFEVLPK